VLIETNSYKNNYELISDLSFINLAYNKILAKPSVSKCFLYYIKEWI
jgi:hypothetical protein